MLKQSYRFSDPAYIDCAKISRGQMNRKFLSLLFMLSISCAPRSTDAEVHSTSQHASALAISGTWLPTSYFGYYYSLPGNREVVRIQDTKFAESGWRLLTNLQPDGRGFAKSFLNCQNELKKGDGYFGAHSPLTFSPFPANVRVMQCPNPRAIEFEREFRFSSITKEKVPAHRMLEKHKSSIHESCNALRGNRYVFIQGPQQNRNQGAYGCIGFSDAAANQLTLLVIPHREAHAVRYDFTRQSSRQ